MVTVPFLAHAPLHAIALLSDNQRYVNFGSSARLQGGFTPQLRPLIQLLDTSPPCWFLGTSPRREGISRQARFGGSNDACRLV
jgi:hypothetical protein